MKKMGFGNGRVPNNEKYGIREWENPEQWKKWDSGMGWSRTMKKWDTGMERSRTMKNMGYGNGTVPKNRK